MRIALWLAALFGVSVALALFVGQNQATVTLFWWPHRVDVSLNLVLLVLVVGFVLLHLMLRALSGLISIPRQAQRWRLQQKERAIYGALLDGLSHQISGRFVRSRKAAELVVSLENAVQRGDDKLPYAGQLRTIVHLLAAESAHALRDRNVRRRQRWRAAARSPLGL